MEFIKEGKREGHSYEVDKIYTLKDLDDTLKKQAVDIREWVAIRKEVICENSTNGFLMAFYKRFLNQGGGKGIKPKEK